MDKNMYSTQCIKQNAQGKLAAVWFCVEENIKKAVWFYVEENTKSSS